MEEACANNFFFRDTGSCIGFTFQLTTKETSNTVKNTRPYVTKSLLYFVIQNGLYQIDMHFDQVLFEEGFAVPMDFCFVASIV
ncbi:hypothetical protein A0J61_08358 [Choanephora cucurbitarum]|uniref:Uncharacterized protein n=1 Tax=Choanephora cucurbitarum TaxID=101091 RepID=A0A1C7N3B9_9FUNG|nr:hypothetical protein A0J61_08358 [Choanephora cucurbitarum]